MTFTDDPARDYEHFCDAQDHGAGDEYEPPTGSYEFVERTDYPTPEEDDAFCAACAEDDAYGYAHDAFRSKRENANPRGKFWDSEESVRHEELYREDLEEPQDVL